MTHQQPACDIATSVRAGTIRASDVIQSALEDIEARDKHFNAFVHVDANLALAQAMEIDKMVADGGDPGLLAGVPFGVKDLHHCQGMPTTYGSLVFKNSMPSDRDDIIVSRLKRAGAIAIGKTATAEFGMDSATTTRAWGTTRNPWDPSRTPGGSSGGSAAAVSAGLVPLATGSDWGGSIRSPAAFTGTVGLKASHGRVGSAMRSELNVHGVLTRTVTDTARALDVIAGPTETDATSLPTAEISFEKLADTLALHRLRMLWSADMGFATVESIVVDIARSAAEELAQATHSDLVDVDLKIPNPYDNWLTMEGFLFLTDLAAQGVWPQHADQLCDLTRFVLESAGQISVAELGQARADRLEIEARVGRVFADADILLTPTTACLAFPAEGPIPNRIEGRDASHSGAEPFTMLANMCWNPSISVPAGLGNTLPVGLQIIGRKGRDDVVLRLARLLEQIRPWPSTPLHDSQSGVRRHNLAT